MFKIFDLTLKLNGFPMKEAKAEFEEICAIPEGDFGNYIEQKKIIRSPRLFTFIRT